MKLSEPVTVNTTKGICSKKGMVVHDESLKFTRDTSAEKPFQYKEYICLGGIMRQRLAEELERAFQTFSEGTLIGLGRGDLNFCVRKAVFAQRVASETDRIWW